MWNIQRVISALFPITHCKRALSRGSFTVWIPYSLAFLTFLYRMTPMQNVYINHTTYIYNFMGGIPIGFFGVPKF